MSSSSGTGSCADEALSSRSSSSDDVDDAYWLPWVRAFLPSQHHQQQRTAAAVAVRRGQGAAGGSGSDSGEEEEAELSASRQLLRRQRERELRGGPRSLHKWERGLGWEGAQLGKKDHQRARTHQRRLMEATARCLAAVRKEPVCREGGGGWVGVNGGGWEGTKARQWLPPVATGRPLPDCPPSAHIPAGAARAAARCHGVEVHRACHHRGPLR